MRIKTFVAVSAALMATLASVPAVQQTYNFLGSSTSSWVGYAGSSVPNLVTTTPGSIVNTSSSGSSYGRLSSGFAAFLGLVEGGRCVHPPL